MQGAFREEKNRRKEFLDVLRVIATCAVVLMHTVTGVTTGFDLTGFDRKQRAFQALVDITSWSVPVFLLISGYLFLDPERQLSWKDMLLKYCRRILLALVLFGIPYSLLELIALERAFRPGMLLQALVNTALGHSWAHMWYLYLILILYTITPGLRWILERLPLQAVRSVQALLLAGCSMVPFIEKWKGINGLPKLPEAGIYLFYYLCGYLFVRGKRETLPWMRVTFLGVFGLSILGDIAARFSGLFLVEMAYSRPLTVLQALLLFAGLRGSLGKGKFSNLWKGLGELCFGIYLIHPVFLNVFYKFLKISLLDFKLVIALPLFFGMALGGAALGTMILRRIPPLKKYVL